jgi:hypothetical protein
MRFINSRLSLLFLFLGMTFSAFAQETDTLETSFFKRIFLPSIDVGVQIPNSDLLGPSLKLATSIEYRLRNNNHFFIRLTYDAYGAPYELVDENNTSNTLQGNVQMSDVLLAPGYRFGDKTWRLMLAVMPGYKFYSFPVAEQTNNGIQISQESKEIFTTSFLVTAEYYFDRKSAVTFSLYQNQVWEAVDFWEDGQSAYGLSIGFITSLL